MDKVLTKRKEELRRRRWALNIEEECLNLLVGGSTEIKILDYEAVDRLRGRIYRLNQQGDRTFRITIEANTATVARIK